MSITTHHPEYDKYLPRWQKTTDFLDGQDTVKAKGELYLPKTSGMTKNVNTGQAQYDAYRKRARVPAITETALTGIIGLMFEKDPMGVSDEIVTNTGLTTLQLARDIARDVSSRGRSILVVDADAAGGSPYIARYPAESLINWKVADDNPNLLTMAILAESVNASDDEYGHETEMQYRKYRLIDGGVEVSLFNNKEELLSDPVLLKRGELPIFCIGSIDISPACDPVPLLPVADCAEAMYQLSADYRHALFLSAQPTPWVKGSTEDQYEKIQQCGLGSGSLLPIDVDGAIGYLETSGGGISLIKSAMDDEESQAESMAVRITQNSSGVEAAQSVQMRAMSQHASIYTMSDSISIGITQALNARAEWSGMTEPEAFQIRTEFSNAEAWLAMLNPLNAAINAGNAPKSVMFELLRRLGLTENDDNDIKSEIESGVVA